MTAIRLEERLSATVDARLGSTEMKVAEIQELKEGSIVAFSTLAGDPFPLYINGSVIGYGEAVVIDDKFGIRITRLV